MRVLPAGMTRKDAEALAKKLIKRPEVLKAIRERDLTTIKRIALAEIKAEDDGAVARVKEDASLREQVVEALAAQGIARPVAAERTNTEVKLLAEAKALELI